MPRSIKKVNCTVGPELGYYCVTDKGRKVYLYNKKFKDFERKCTSVSFEPLARFDETEPLNNENKWNAFYAAAQAEVTRRQGLQLGKWGKRKARDARAGLVRAKKVKDPNRRKYAISDLVPVSGKTPFADGALYKYVGKAKKTVGGYVMVQDKPKWMLMTAPSSSPSMQTDDDDRDEKQIPSRPTIRALRKGKRYPDTIDNPNRPYFNPFQPQPLSEEEEEEEEIEMNNPYDTIVMDNPYATRELQL